MSDATYMKHLSEVLDDADKKLPAMDLHSKRSNSTKESMLLDLEASAKRHTFTDKDFPPHHFRVATHDVTDNKGNVLLMGSLVSYDAFVLEDDFVRKIFQLCQELGQKTPIISIRLASPVHLKLTTEKEKLDVDMKLTGKSPICVFASCSQIVDLTHLHDDGNSRIIVHRHVQPYHVYAAVNYQLQTKDMNYRILPFPIENTSEDTKHLGEMFYESILVSIPDYQVFEKLLGTMLETAKDEDSALAKFAEASKYSYEVLGKRADIIEFTPEVVEPHLIHTFYSPMTTLHGVIATNIPDDNEIREQSLKLNMLYS